MQKSNFQRAIVSAMRSHLKALLFPFAIAPIQVMPAAPFNRIERLLKCQNKAAAGSNAGSCCYAYA